MDWQHENNLWTVHKNFAAAPKVKVSVLAELLSTWRFTPNMQCQCQNNRRNEIGVEDVQRVFNRESPHTLSACTDTSLTRARFYAWLRLEERFTDCSGSDPTRAKWSSKPGSSQVKTSRASSNWAQDELGEEGIIIRGIFRTSGLMPWPKSHLMRNPQSTQRRFWGVPIQSRGWNMNGWCQWF